MDLNKIYKGDCLEVMRTFPDKSIDCVITSTPYWIKHRKETRLKKKGFLELF